jgi:hypothetical protein
MKNKSDRMPLPPADLLRSLLEYDPATGSLIWKVRGGLYPTKGDNGFNSRFAGKRAGREKVRGHRQINIDGVHYSEGRLIWKIMTGEDPDGYVFHRNDDHGDMRWHNLYVEDGSHRANKQAIRLSARIDELEEKLRSAGIDP